MPSDRCLPEGARKGASESQGDSFLLQGLNDTDAASLPLVALTVVQALNKLLHQGEHMRGKRILIHAGTP